jgi:O-antigen/teichoic acid export membrane protein
LTLQQIYNRIISSSLFRSSGIYTSASIINASIPLFLLPILTDKLSPADYGIVSMFQIVVSFLYPFIGMNLEGAIARKYFDKNKSDFPSYIGTALILSCISFILVSFLFFCNLDYIHNLTSIPLVWLKYILIYAECQFLIAIILIRFQVSVQPIKYGLLQISQSIINLGLTLFFVLILNKTWEGRLEALIISCVIIATISIFLLIYNKYIKFNVKKSDVIHALKFGIPLIPHAIGGMLFTTIDRLFLTKMIGLEQTGNYTVAYQIGAVISILTLSFNKAFSPWLFEQLNMNDFVVNLKIVKFTYLYFIILIIGAILTLIGFPFVVDLFVDGKYKNVNGYSLFIVFGFVFQGMYFMVTNYITYSEKTYILGILTLIVGLMKLPITYFSILYFGAVGASISYFFTFLLFFIAAWIISAKVYKMPWNLKKQ